MISSKVATTSIVKLPLRLASSSYMENMRVASSNYMDEGNSVLSNADLAV